MLVTVTAITLKPTANFKFQTPKPNNLYTNSRSAIKNNIDPKENDGYSCKRLLCSLEQAPYDIHPKLGSPYTTSKSILIKMAPLTGIRTTISRYMVNCILYGLYFILHILELYYVLDMISSMYV